MSGLAKQVVSNLPDVFLVVKHLRIAHVKSSIGLCLRAKNNFRITRVAAQVRGHRGSRLKQFREQMLVRLNDGIARIEYIQRNFPRVRIHGGLHRIPNVIGAFVEASDGKRRRIRMREGSRISVHHPN